MSLLPRAKHSTCRSLYLVNRTKISAFLLIEPSLLFTRILDLKRSNGRKYPNFCGWKSKCERYVQNTVACPGYCGEVVENVQRCAWYVIAKHSEKSCMFKSSNLLPLLLGRPLPIPGPRPRVRDLLRTAFGERIEGEGCGNTME